jgi:hypothetical protein
MKNRKENKPPSGADFKRLEAAVNEVCAKLLRKRKIPDGWCANFAGLECADIRWAININGETYWEAEVIEAAPENWQMQEWFRSELAKFHGVHVTVIFEWQ